MANRLQGEASQLSVYKAINIHLTAIKNHEHPLTAINYSYKLL